MIKKDCIYYDSKFICRFMIHEECLKDCQFFIKLNKRLQNEQTKSS